MWFQIFLSIFLCLLLVIGKYLYVQKQNFSSLKKRGIPHFSPRFIFGNWFELEETANKNDFIHKCRMKFGDTFGYYFGWQRFIVLNDLDMIANVFLTHNKITRNRENFILNPRYLRDSMITVRDENWRMIRRLMSPMFSIAKVQDPAIYDVMNSCIEKLKEVMDEKVPEPGKTFEIDVTNISQAFTLDVIARTSFAINEDVYQPGNNLKKAAKGFFIHSNNILVTLATFFRPLAMTLSFINNYFLSGKLTTIIVNRIRLHLKQTYSSKESIKNLKDLKNAQLLKSLMQSFSAGQIHEDELIGNVFLILLAGYETSSNSIANGLFLLAKHQDIQDRLRKDIAENGLKSKYLEQVWMETLRIHPPIALFINRSMSEDLEVNGVQLVKGDIVQVPVWEIHHNPSIWHDPYTFDPDRFTEENRALMHPCQFVPFGLGPRICLGMNFANQEGKLALYYFISRYRIQFTENSTPDIKFIMRNVIINPVHNIKLLFSKI